MENPIKNGSDGTTVLSKKSWVAYVLPSLLSGWLFIILFQAYMVSALVPILYMVYKILMLRSHELYADDEGIWLYRGILPWDKGVSGVKWRDLDDAVYFTGFISWATKSYRISLQHRFTKDSEIFLYHMMNGDKAVTTINKLHQSRVSDNSK